MTTTMNTIDLGLKTRDLTPDERRRRVASLIEEDARIGRELDEFKLRGFSQYSMTATRLRAARATGRAELERLHAVDRRYERGEDFDL